MEFERLPVGFAMALAQNQPAMEHFASMPAEEKRQIVDRAHHVHDKHEVREIVSRLAEKR